MGQRDDPRVVARRGGAGAGLGGVPRLAAAACPGALLAMAARVPQIAGGSPRDGAGGSAPAAFNPPGAPRGPRAGSRGPRAGSRRAAFSADARPGAARCRERAAARLAAGGGRLRRTRDRGVAPGAATPREQRPDAGRAGQGRLRGAVPAPGPPPRAGRVDSARQRQPFAAGGAPARHPFARRASDRVQPAPGALDAGARVDPSAPAGSALGLAAGGGARGILVPPAGVAGWTRVVPGAGAGLRRGGGTAHPRCAGRLRRGAVESGGPVLPGCRRWLGRCRGTGVCIKRSKGG